MPNLLPYLAASFVGAVSAAILASVGLEALGLGPQNEPTLGMTIYWAHVLHRGPARACGGGGRRRSSMIVVIFIGLFLISAGLDQIANPRLTDEQASSADRAAVLRPVRRRAICASTTTRRAGR